MHQVICVSQVTSSGIVKKRECAYNYVIIIVQTAHLEVLSVAIWVIVEPLNADMFRTSMKCLNERVGVSKNKCPEFQGVKVPIPLGYPDSYP